MEIDREHFSDDDSPMVSFDVVCKHVAFCMTKKGNNREESKARPQKIIK